MRARKIVTAALSASLVFGSTGATAAAAPTASNPQSSWLALSMLTTGGAIGLGGAGVQLPPPDNPPPPHAYGAAPTPPIPVIAVWLATLATAVYILAREHHGRVFFPSRISPS
jgi:hypothetical protein